jgi:hypothetical protein
MSDEISIEYEKFEKIREKIEEKIWTIIQRASRTRDKETVKLAIKLLDKFTTLSREFDISKLLEAESE